MSQAFPTPAALRLPLAAALACLALASPGGAQTPSLVLDIRLGAIGSGPREFVALGNELLFTANDGVNGSEPWISDGTGAGTTLLSDIRPGGSSFPGRFTPFGATALFMADDGTHGGELWSTDGTTAGTQLVRDIQPGASASNVFPRVELSGLLYLTASDGSTGNELWRTDGTSGGTTLVADIRPGASSSSPTAFATLPGLVLFRADDGTHGGELWKSDGTTTQIVVDLYPGLPNGVGGGEIASFGGEVYFAGNDGVSGVELWKSDGSPGGTTRVADINPGAAGSNPSDWVALGSFLYFVASDGSTGNEIWRTDGTVTSQVKDVNPGAGSGLFANGSLCAAGGRLFFAGTDGVNGMEIWSSDGTNAGTAMLVDVDPGAGSGVYFESLHCTGGRAYFSGDDGVLGKEPWVSDGSVAGTLPLADLEVGAGDSIGFQPTFLDVAGTVFFDATTAATGSELWEVAGPAPAGVPALPLAGFFAIAIAILGAARVDSRRDRIIRTQRATARILAVGGLCAAMGVLGLAVVKSAGGGLPSARIPVATGPVDPPAPREGGLPREWRWERKSVPCDDMYHEGSTAGLDWIRSNPDWWY